MSERTRWRFNVPQAGEVDSAESVERLMVEVDQALIGPMHKAELLSHGAKLNPQHYVDGDKSYYSTEPDEYWTTIEGRPIYTTKTHYHPIPKVVLSSNKADKATLAESATKADTALRLTNGINLNGLMLTGGDSVQNVILKTNHIPDATRTFWGGNDPSDASLPSLRKGDIYVKVL